MAEALSAQGAAFEMHYCARSPERTAFRQRIGAAPFAPQVHFHYDSGDTAQKLDLPGLLARLDRQTHMYLCGPAGFIDHVLATAKAHDWPAGPTAPRILRRRLRAGHGRRPAVRGEAGIQRQGVCHPVWQHGDAVLADAGRRHTRILRAGRVRHLPDARAAAEPLKVGLILPMSGPFASTGRQVDAAVKLYLQQHGATVAGRKIEIILKDDGGVSPDVTKRLAQELVARDKVRCWPASA
jgi:hypothetical protein